MRPTIKRHSSRTVVPCQDGVRTVRLREYTDIAVDLLESLRMKLNVLPDGDHSAGLRAVLIHVEAAFKHLSRGQELADESLFTDAVYRTNQAFEGSIKEAYRVLAGIDPAKLRPFDIENYLDKNKVFKARVLAQFKNYRTEWRNPSTHDYTLLFDESEALLAIISVAGFAYLLFDEIAEKLSEKASQAKTEAEKPRFGRITNAENDDLFTRVKGALIAFAGQQRSDPLKTESQMVGALTGFLTTLMPQIKVESDKPLGTDRKGRADLVIGDADSTVIVELKRAKANRSSVEGGFSQLASYMACINSAKGILFYVPEEPEDMDVAEIPKSRVGGDAVLLTPKSSTSISSGRL